MQAVKPVVPDESWHTLRKLAACRAQPHMTLPVPTHRNATRLEIASWTGNDMRERESKAEEEETCVQVDSMLRMSLAMPGAFPACRFSLLNSCMCRRGREQVRFWHRQSSFEWIRLADLQRRQSGSQLIKQARAKLSHAKYSTHGHYSPSSCLLQQDRQNANTQSDMTSCNVSHACQPPHLQQHCHHELAQDEEGDHRQQEEPHGGGERLQGGNEQGRHIMADIMVDIMADIMPPAFG